MTKLVQMLALVGAVALLLLTLMIWAVLLPESDRSGSSEERPTPVSSVAADVPSAIAPQDIAAMRWWSFPC